MSIPVPLYTGETDNAGNKRKSSITVGLTPPILGGRKVWNVDSTDVLPGGSFTSTHASVRVANDGNSMLVTSISAGNVVIELKNNEYQSWQPGHIYRINDVILDKNGNIQKVTAASKLAPIRYTPESGKVPQGGEQLYFVELSVTSVASSVGNTAVYTVSPVNAAGASNGFAGRTFRVAGFVTHASNNGKFVCVASANNSVTLMNPNAISESGVTASAKSIGAADDPQGYARVLNQGDGDINGDWPAGAFGGANADTNFQGVDTAHFDADAIALTTAAPVTFEVLGFSSGLNAGGVDRNSQAGIESPNSTSNDSRVTVAEYSEIGVGGQKVYLDAAGNSHTGWQIAKGTQTFALTLNEPPTFSTVNGATTVDNDLIWTKQASAPTDSDVWDTITLAVTDPSPAIAGNTVLLPLE